MRRVRLALAGLALAALACTAVQSLSRQQATPDPSPAAATTRPPQATLAPTATALFSPTAPASPTPRTRRPVPAEGEARACAYVPGISVPASMPSDALAFATPAPSPSPVFPAAEVVDAATTARQRRIQRELWETVSTEYVHPDFNGKDWTAIGARYQQLIEAGLSDESFYRAMGAMLAELDDEHSYFESPAEVLEADAQYAGNIDYVGVGVLVMPIPQAERGVILLVFPGGPADEAGLRSHDSILRVDSQPLLDASGDLRDVIRGPEGTSVTLTIQPPGGQPADLTLVRRRITGALPIDYCLMPGTRVGYLFLPGLDDETIPEQVRAALRALTAEGPLDGLVLDNRVNSGGASSVLEGVLGLFTRGTVGHFLSRDARRPLTIAAEDVGGSQSVPLVVLVDVDTASFGEVLSGVLQAAGRARVIGQTSLGNVETLWGYTFEDGSRAWIAHETFQPLDQPNGIWEDTGIVPDVFLPTRWDLFSEGDDPALAAAVELLQVGVPQP